MAKEARKHWMGLKLPFGASVAYYPAETTKIGKKTNVLSAAARLLPGISLGYELNTNCVWKGGYIVAPMRAFAGLDLSKNSKISVGKSPSM